MNTYGALEVIGFKVVRLWDFEPDRTISQGRSLNFQRADAPDGAGKIQQRGCGHGERTVWPLLDSQKKQKTL